MGYEWELQCLVIDPLNMYMYNYTNHDMNLIFLGLGIKDRLKSNQFVFFTLWMKSARAGYDLKMNTENLRKN